MAVSIQYLHSDYEWFDSHVRLDVERLESVRLKW